MVTRKSRAEIERMKQAGRVVAEVLDKIEAEIRPGTSTADLDAIAEAHILASGATPSFKGYPGINPRRPFTVSLIASPRIVTFADDDASRMSAAVCTVVFAPTAFRKRKVCRASELRQP